MGSNNEARGGHFSSVTFGLASVLITLVGISAAVGPTGNAIAAYFSLQGVKDAIMWGSIAVAAGSASALAFVLERKSIYS